MILICFFSLLVCIWFINSFMFTFVSDSLSLSSGRAAVLHLGNIDWFWRNRIAVYCWSSELHEWHGAGSTNQMRGSGWWDSRQNVYADFVHHRQLSWGIRPHCVSWIYRSFIYLSILYSCYRLIDIWYLTVLKRKKLKREMTSKF